MRVFCIVIFLFCAISGFSQAWHFSDSLYYILVETDSIKTRTEGHYERKVTCVNVYKQGDHKLIQKIRPTEFTYSDYVDSSLIFVYEDVNFDGYKDIRIANWLSINLQVSYSYWIYSPEKKSFIKNTALDKLWNVSFNPEQKTIHSYWRIAFSELGHARYRWENDSIILIMKEEWTSGIDPAIPPSITLTTIENGIEKYFDRAGDDEAFEEFELLYMTDLFPAKK